jgi:hypothetical protein
MKRSNSRSQRTLFSLLLHLRHRSHQEGGYIIVVVAGMIVALSAMLLTAELVTRVDSKSTKSSGNSSAGFYAAEAGLNLRAKAIRAKFEGYNVPSGTSPSTTPPYQPCKNSNDGDGDFICDNSLTIQDYLYPNDSTKRIPVSTYVIDQNPRVGGVAQPTSVTINPGEPFAGLTAQEFRYDVSSTAYDRVTNQPTAFLGIRFKSRLVPLFQFAAFYEQDLDYSNPPEMTMNGPIHSNSNIYLNSGAGSLTINGTISMGGQFFRGERMDGSSCGGTVRIFSPIPSPGGFQSLACGTSGRREYLQTEVTPTWGPNQIKIGIPKLTLPSANTFTADSSGDYWKKAQLRLVLKLDSAEKPTGIEVQTVSGATDTTSTNKLLGNTCAPTTTTLGSGGAATGTTSLPTTSATAANFPLASALQLEPAATSNYVNNTAIDNDANIVSSTGSTLTIKKQLGGAPLSPLNFSGGTVVRKAAVWTSDTFYNYREKTGAPDPRTDAKQIRMLNVDMKALMTCANQLMGGKNINDTENGGLVWYLTVKGPKSNNNVRSIPADAPNSYGIRLYNGDTLASSNAGDPAIKGLTVVSDQAMYIRGDYNSVDKKPASILADTINVLSNAWPLDDSFSRKYTSGVQDTPTYVYSFETPRDASNGNIFFYQRPATSTTINAAFLAGIDLTGGGLNNYPRLHEDWYNPNTGTRATLTYRGSMVSLGLPKRVNGEFCGSGTSSNTARCNIYTPATRNWDYDTDFNNAANLPPLTPRFVYLRQERFSRDYTRTSFLPFLSSPFASFFPANFVATLPTITGGRFIF